MKGNLQRRTLECGVGKVRPSYAELYKVFIYTTYIYLFLKHKRLSTKADYQLSCKTSLIELIS